jgi:hypothetical protein
MTDDSKNTCDNPDLWCAWLESEFSKVKSGQNKARAWTFDMDDGPELERLEGKPLERVKRTLEFLQAEIYPKWKKADHQAIVLQKRHRRITRMAIWFGVAAVVAAIFALVLSHIVPGVMMLVFLVELIAVLAALVAIIAGVWLRTHHGWLTSRQIAERLRSLQFQSVTWPELWCDEPLWQTRTRNAIAELAGLTNTQAEVWAKEADTAAPPDVVKPPCDVPAEEVTALTAWYRVKRLEYQQHYFDFQANRTHERSWGHRWKLSLKLFVASVVAVLCHGFVAIFLVQGDHGHAAHDPAHVKDGTSFWHGVEIVLIGLAALLPVLGFGIRAWTSAFESPRSHNLFRAKSMALNEPIRRLKQDLSAAIDCEDVMWTIADSEHFFLGEHREWCRLQVEAEWYF